MILFTASLLNVATIRKEEDPILKTQTDPILYKKKLEEIKDGVKGAPAPTFRHYEKESFLTADAVEAGREEETVKPAPAPEVSEVSLAPHQDSAKNSVKESNAGDKDEDWWAEEEAQDKPQH